MSEQPDQPTPAPGDGSSFSQEVRHTNVSARVPEKVGRGVFCTGAMVIQGQHEFIIDFVQRMNQPHQVVARVVLPYSIMASFIAALRDNYGKYQARFGAPPALTPPPPGAKPPPIEEIYEQLKMPEEVQSGAYANCVMVVHSPGEFCLDFITTFYPRSGVSCRVFLSAAQVPGLLGNLQTSFQQFQQRQGGNQPPPGPQ